MDWMLDCGAAFARACWNGVGGPEDGDGDAFGCCMLEETLRLCV